MIKALLIDDEPLARMVLRDLLQNFDDIEILGECANGYEGVKSITELKPDLIFLDVQMPKINGFEMLEILEHPPNVIFVTAYDEYAVNAFNVNAIDYLLKPIALERLEQALDKVRKNMATSVDQQIVEPKNIVLPEQMQRVVVKDNGEIKIIPLTQLMYVEAADDYIKLYTADRYYLKHFTMSKLSQQLPEEQFVRIHRSYFANISFIQKIELVEKDQYHVILHNQTRLPISKTGYSTLKIILGI